MLDGHVEELADRFTGETDDTGAETCGSELQKAAAFRGILLITIFSSQSTQLVDFRNYGVKLRKPVARAVQVVQTAHCLRPGTSEAALPLGKI
ncbi:hypothetical protein, partial [Sinosporangium album]|uniref:hypothetical protein n=1 Tax=Sinosporangium album TaxID=504805 RepID=UPI001C40BAC1